MTNEVGPDANLAPDGTLLPLDKLKPLLVRAEATAAPPSKTDDSVESWFVEFIHNSPASRDTAIYNHVRASVDALKQRLNAL